MSRRVVVLHSGGLDSTTLLYHLRSMDMEVFPLGIYYGQRHQRELVSANAIYEQGQFQAAKVINLPDLQSAMGGSSQTDSSIQVPDGHYSADNMAITVVPNRNMILLSIATAYAISLKAGVVAYAAHIGDHDQYPDCRQMFIDALSGAIKLCDTQPPTLSAPFSGLSKAQIAERAIVLGVPIELTYSCYKGREKHCGRCGTCVERLEALHIAKESLRSTMSFEDKTEYEDTEFWRTVTKLPLALSHKELRKTLLAHRYLYYVLGKPVLSDRDYDLLERTYPHNDLGVGSDLAGSYTQEVVSMATLLLSEKG